MYTAQVRDKQDVGEARGKLMQTQVVETSWQNGAQCCSNWWAGECRTVYEQFRRQQFTPIQFEVNRQFSVVFGTN